MLKLKLKISGFARKNGMPWTSCTPFVDNSRAQLIHRPFSVTTFKTHKGSHNAVHYWCGSASCGTNKFTFLDSLNGNKLLCARCEERAISQGLPSADELVGRHVHKGKLVAVQTCCSEGA